ncbi:MAG TPA: MBL fold metallo-hydrolase, partial [Aeromicrobium sp.]|nr:MBL fold metallo-hydrolase [Aeromicrobium sp.]
VGDGVLAVRGRDANWTILRDAASFTLVDAGYPGYGADVRASIRRAGLDLAGLEAIVVTHAHIDHIGGVPALLADVDAPVYVGASELPMAVGDRVESAAPLDVAKRLWKPRMVPWSLRITAAGGVRHVRVAGAIGVPDGATLDIPGRPMVVLTPGHTSGHICLRAGTALLTGDALITGHAISGRKGPQLAADFFHTDPGQAVAALDRIAAVEASAIVPGHGPVWRGAPSDAVAIARGTAA